MADSLEVPLVNPGMRFGRPVLFNADKYEENPGRRKGRRRKAGRGARRGRRVSRRAARAAPRRRRRSYKRNPGASENPTFKGSTKIFIPSSAFGVRRRRRKAGRKRKAGRPRKTRRRKAARKAVRKAPRRRKAARKARKAPRRVRKTRRRRVHRVPRGVKLSRRRRSVITGKPYKKGFTKRRRAALRKAMRARHLRAPFEGEYQSNPMVLSGYQENRRRARKRGGRRKYHRNPFFGGFGVSSWTRPSWPDLSVSTHGLGSVALGAAAFGLGYCLFDGVFPGKYFGWSRKIAPNNELIQDAVTVTGSVIVGTAVNYLVSRYVPVVRDHVSLRNMQSGLWVAAGVTVIGVVAKHLLRAVRGVQLTAGGIRPPLNAVNGAAAALGFGEIAKVYYENKLAEALKTANIVVAGNEGGQTALVHGQTGEVLMSGPAPQMVPVVQALQGAQVRTTGFGEDITMES